MSLPASAPVLLLDLRPSPRLRAACTVLYLLVAGLLVTVLTGWTCVTALAVLAIACARDLANVPPRVARRDPEGQWWLDGRGPFALRRTTVVTPWLVVLHLAGPAGGRRIPLPADSLSPVQWRRLRVQLRLHPAATRPGPA